MELGGALKNVLAIGCGMSDGLGFGSNGRAALITRGLDEITRLAGGWLAGWLGQYFLLGREVHWKFFHPASSAAVG